MCELIEIPFSDIEEAASRLYLLNQNTDEDFSDDMTCNYKILLAVITGNYKFLSAEDWNYTRYSLMDQGLLFAAYPDEKMLSFLLSKGVSPNEQDEFGRTILHYAAEDNNLELLKLLIDHGANPEIKDVYGIVPFTAACHENSLDAVKFFYERGVKPDTVKRSIPDAFSPQIKELLQKIRQDS